MKISEQMKDRLQKVHGEYDCYKASVSSAFYNAMQENEALGNEHFYIRRLFYFDVLHVLYDLRDAGLKEFAVNRWATSSIFQQLEAEGCTPIGKIEVRDKFVSEHDKNRTVEAYLYELPETMLEYIEKYVF